MNTSNQLFSHISFDGELTLSLVEVDVPKPKAHEIVVKIEASPINPLG
jgi:NADPH:quinone reductase-like Zn-dependent oxidoreductase